MAGELFFNVSHQLKWVGGLTSEATAHTIARGRLAEALADLIGDSTLAIKFFFLNRSPTLSHGPTQFNPIGNTINLDGLPLRLVTLDGVAGSIFLLPRNDTSRHSAATTTTKTLEPCNHCFCVFLCFCAAVNVRPLPVLGRCDTEYRVVPAHRKKRAIKFLEIVSQTLL